MGPLHGLPLPVLFTAFVLALLLFHPSECSVVVVSSIEEDVEKAGEALHGRQRRSNW